MLKKAIVRGLNSFMYSIGITTTFYFILIIIKNDANFVPVVPEFSRHFNSELIAFNVQSFLIGITSWSFGFWSILLEWEKISFLCQSILYFIVTAVVWVPVSIYCWCFTEHVATFISVLLTYLVAYSISLGIQYRLCKQDIHKINEKLEALRKEG